MVLWPQSFSSRWEDAGKTREAYVQLELEVRAAPARGGSCRNATIKRHCILIWEQEACRLWLTKMEEWLLCGWNLKTLRHATETKEIEGERDTFFNLCLS